MTQFQDWVRQLDFSLVYQYTVIISASLVCIIIHEISHGYTALALGDRTAKDSGRLSFNPIRHIDIWGLLMMALFRFGWAKPVPIDMRNFKHPIRGMAITAAAGPISNLLLAWIAIFIQILISRFHLQHTVFLFEFLEYVAVLSVGLAVFNIIPIPPLDGSKVLNVLLPKTVYYRILRYEKYGFLIMMVLLYSGILRTPLSFARTHLLQAMYYSVTAIINLH